MFPKQIFDDKDIILLSIERLITDEKIIDVYRETHDVWVGLWDGSNNIYETVVDQEEISHNERKYDFEQIVKIISMLPENVQKRCFSNFPYNEGEIKKRILPKGMYLDLNSIGVSQTMEQ
jgi:hypothetical protein